MGDQVVLLDKVGVQVYLEIELYCGVLKNICNMYLYLFNLCIGEVRVVVGFGVLIFEYFEVLDIVYGLWLVVIICEGRIEVQQILFVGDVYYKFECRQFKGMIFLVMGGIVIIWLLGELVWEINLQGLVVYDCCFVFDYYCFIVDGCLLFGGGVNYLGCDLWDIVVELWLCIECIFLCLKGVEIEFQWSCVMGIVMNWIFQFGKFFDNVWYCQGYLGYGVVISYIMGEIMVKVMSGSLEQFDIFVCCKYFRVLLGDFFGNLMLVVGMWYYQFMEKLC